MLNDVLEDPTFKTFYRSCMTDLCNGGDGLKDPSAQKISPDGFDGENLLVPGLPLSGASKIINGKMNFLYSIMMILIFRRKF